MDNVMGSARLASEIPPERTVATTVSREAIAAALEDAEGPPPLLLDVERRFEDGRDDRATISVTWSRSDLEEVLERATNGHVTLTFDRAELEQALADVEAHGLRERALVLTVAAATALGTAAGVSQARPLVDEGSASAGSAVAYTDASSGGGYGPSSEATAADDVVTDVSSGGGYTAAASEADSMVTDASSGGGYAAAPSAESSSGGMFDTSAPSPLEGVLVGAAALAIAGATFASRRPKATRPA
jgi:hypothetical protein